MYFNVFGERVSRARYREMLNATKNRRELIAAGLNRRDLFKMGLLTSAGYADSRDASSQPVGDAFVMPLPIMPCQLNRSLQHHLIS